MNRREVEVPDFDLIVRLAFEKDKEIYQKLAEQRAHSRYEEFLSNFQNYDNENFFCFAKEKILEACKTFEIGNIIDRLKHREIIRMFYPESMKDECLKKWSV